MDGSTLDLADTAANEAAFGRPGASRGRSGYPQLRFVALLENGTHVLFATEMGGYGRGESTLAHGVVAELGPMLCLADRNFFSYALWKRSQEGGSHLLWRVKKNLRLPCLERLADGSYRSKIYPSDKARRRDQEGLAVRVGAGRSRRHWMADPLAGSTQCAARNRSWWSRSSMVCCWLISRYGVYSARISHRLS